jgi:hypothetical protein
MKPQQGHAGDGFQATLRLLVPATDGRHYTRLLPELFIFRFRLTIQP